MLETSSFIDFTRDEAIERLHAKGLGALIAHDSL